MHSLTIKQKQKAERKVMQRITSLFGKTRDLAEFVMLEVQIGAHQDNTLERVPIEYED